MTTPVSHTTKSQHSRRQGRARDLGGAWTVACLVCIGSMTGVPEAASEVLLPPGTTVAVKSLGRISSNSDGNASFEVAYDVVSGDGEVIVAHGTPVHASVETTRRRSRGRPGRIHVVFERTSTVTGQVLELVGAHTVAADDKRGLSLGLTFGTLPAIPPFNFFFFLIKGNTAVIEKGCVIETAKTVSAVQSGL